MEKSEAAKRTVIWSLWKQQKKQADIYRELLQIFGEDAPSKQTVSKWVQRFEDGWETVDDAPRPGAPRSSTSSDNIQRVQHALDDDRGATLRQLEDLLAIPMKSIHRIISDHLHMTRVVARWVPKLLTPVQLQERVQMCRHLLNAYQNEPDFLGRLVTGDETWFHFYEPETKQQSSVWKATHEPPPVKAKAVQSAGKRMATVFWDREGILLIEWLPEGRTINAQYYCEILERLREKIKSERRGRITRGTVLQQDNARPHTCNATMDVIRRLGFELLPHPAYSPDLAPSDYWLFPKMKEPLRGHRYGSLSALSSAISQWVRGTPTEFFAQGISKLPERWHKCVQLGGDYVEKCNVDN